MSKWDSLSLGKQAMTRKEYYEGRGKDNGNPVNWQPKHRHAKQHDQARNDLRDHIE